MELKWILAIALEAGFWLMLAAFLVLRYRYGLEGITRLFVIGVVIDTAGILALAVWDFANTGHFSTYTVFIGALVVYGLTSGREHFVQLDRWMARRIKPKRARQRATSRPLPERS
jgi:uncharacterized membrane protein YczE